tara:strand:- start:87 stop:455 length:369 start_codon:yes stop_codon:yes gene_type:complete
MQENQVISISDLLDRKLGNTSRPVLFEFFNDDGTEKDMTGVLAFVQFRAGSTSGFIRGDFSIGTGLTWVSESLGQLRVDQILILDWPVDTYYYDVRLKFTDGSIKTYVRGTMNVIPIITKTS